MRTLKTSRRELEHVAVCVTGEVSAEFIRDIQETMRRENQRQKRRSLSVVFSISSIGLLCEMTLLDYKSIANIK